MSIDVDEKSSELTEKIVSQHEKLSTRGWDMSVKLAAKLIRRCREAFAVAERRSVICSCLMIKKGYINQLSTDICPERAMMSVEAER